MSLGKLRMLSHFPAQSEIPQFDSIKLVDKNVGRFDISVKNFSPFFPLISTVTVLQGQKNLICNFPDDILKDRF